MFFFTFPWFQSGWVDEEVGPTGQAKVTHDQLCAGHRKTRDSAVRVWPTGPIHRCEESANSAAQTDANLERTEHRQQRQVGPTPDATVVSIICRQRPRRRFHGDDRPAPTVNNL